MSKQVIEMLVGAAVLVIGAAFVVFAFTSPPTGSVEGYRITAIFSDASGLAPGTDVRIAGVKVGSVLRKRFDPEAFEAELTLVIDGDLRLPLDSEARIVPDGLLGGNFILLKPGASSIPVSAGGRLENTRGAINVIDIIGEMIFDADSEATAAQ